MPDSRAGARVQHIRTAHQRPLSVTQNTITDRLSPTPSFQRIIPFRCTSPCHPQNLRNDHQPPRSEQDYRYRSRVLRIPGCMAVSRSIGVASASGTVLKIDLCHARSCFYSRKSFFFPERQQGPHRNWQQEVSFLDGVFGECTCFVLRQSAAN